MKNWLTKLFAAPVEESPVEKLIERLPHDDRAEAEVEKIYQARWVWYHTILAVEILCTNILLIAILFVLAIK